VTVSYIHNRSNCELKVAQNSIKNYPQESNGAWINTVGMDRFIYRLPAHGIAKLAVVSYYHTWHYGDAIRQIESAQRNFTKRLPGFAHIDYDDRLTALNIDSLELRRLHPDHICVCKILFGLLDVRTSAFFSFLSNTYNTRGYPCKLHGNQPLQSLTPVITSLQSST
jgi:hypothetical protein